MSAGDVRYRGTLDTRPRDAAGFAKTLGYTLRNDNTPGSEPVEFYGSITSRAASSPLYGEEGDVTVFVRDLASARRAFVVLSGYVARYGGAPLEHDGTNGATGTLTGTRRTLPRALDLRLYVMGGNGSVTMADVLARESIG